jgi:predicted phage terminase large subunit-like protein
MKKNESEYYKVISLQIVSDECKRSFFYFVKTFWDVIIAEKPVYNWHIPYLCKELQELSVSIINREKKPYDLIINIPPGTTKSTIATIMYPAWLWTQDPTIRIITNSYSADLSIEHAVKSRDIILSDKYRRLFPNIVIRRDKAAKSAYENTAKGSRYTTSTGSKITGFHAHLIISDDPLNPSQAASEADRKTANEHTKTLASRKVDKANTPTITIMQRLHEMDVTGYLLSKKSEKIKHICLPAELTDNVKPLSLRNNYINGLLDPVRLSREVLEEQKIDLGSMGYAGQYEQNPVADGGNIVKKEWFKYISQADFSRFHGKEPITFWIDTAFTEKKENDPTGIIGTCRIGNNMYVVCAQKVYMKFPDLIRFIPTYVKGNGYTNQSTIRIEPKANGISVVDQLKESTGLNVVEIKSELVSDDKRTRINSASPKIECGRVFLFEGEWNEEFVEEICGFPAKAHDEYVDLISYANDYHLTDKTEKQEDIEELLNNLY